MSKFYTPKKNRNLFNPESKEPFKISRSKIDLFLNCPKCFYLDRRLGVGQPPGYPFSLNAAVDALMKKEFDIHRAKGESHPLMKAYGIDAIPFNHEKMNEWRDTMRGIQHLHKSTNLLISGAIDDIWINSIGELMVVDYKSTAKKDEVDLEADWQIGYKRQAEIYQWLFRKNNFKVLDTAYFVYCNGDTDKEAFDGKLEFNISILPYKGSDSWVEKTIFDIYECLKKDELPLSGQDCDFCRYREAVKDVEDGFN